MNIFTKQNSIFVGFKALLNASSFVASGYSLFFQETAEVSDSLPALISYVKNDTPINNEDQTSIGNHTRNFTLTIRIMLDSTNPETLETVADNLYSLIYNYGETSNIILMVQNPSLSYQFEESNNYQVADLDIPISYKV